MRRIFGGVSFSGPFGRRLRSFPTQVTNWRSCVWQTQPSANFSSIDGFAMNLAQLCLHGQSVVSVGGAAIGHCSCRQDTGGYGYQLLHVFSNLIEMRILNNIGSEKLEFDALESPGLGRLKQQPTTSLFGL
jgi:hypothetical protein